jgi:ferrochelatase
VRRHSAGWPLQPAELPRAAEREAQRLQALALGAKQ